MTISSPMLNGRTALITGASSGIGARLAEVFAAAGARVVLAARRMDRTQALADRIGETGGQALAVPLDVTDEASIIAAYEAIEREFGPVDTLVANSGISAAGRSTELPRDDITRVFDTNLMGVYLTVREGAKRMMAAGSRDSGRGRIVLIGSITAMMTGQGDAAYATSKAAVDHLGRQFAREWVRMGINVNTVQPGYIRTELAGDWFDTDGGAKQIAGWHRRRLMDIDALDETVLFLASDASRYITGATITVDDGQAL